MELDEHIRMRISDERKTKWQRAADERNEALAVFIRRAVDVYLEEDTSHVERNNLDVITDELQSIRTLIDGGAGSVTHRLTALEGQLSTNAQADDLAATLYGLLPERLPEREGAMFDEHTQTETSGLPEHLARHVDADIRQVQHALEELKAEFHTVQERDGRYFRQ